MWMRRGAVRALRALVRGIAVTLTVASMALAAPATLEPLISIEAHPEGGVAAVALPTNNQLIATIGSSDGRVAVWQMPQGTLVKAWKEAGWPQAVAFTPDGSRLAIGTLDNDIPVYEPSTGRRVSTLPFGGSVQALAYSPDGLTLAAGGQGGVCMLLSTKTARPIHSLKGARAAITRLAFSPDGQKIAAASSRENSARIYRVSDGQLLQTLKRTETLGQIDDLAWMPDGKGLLTSGDNHPVSRWDVTTGALLGPAVTPPPLASYVAIRASGDLLSTGFYADFEVWDLPEHKQWLSLVGHTSTIEDLAFTSDGRYLVSASYDGTVKVWEIPPSDTL